jgi:hypothetical protein
MNGRLKGLGIVLVLAGFAFIAGGGYTYFKTQEGSRSLQAFSAAQGVKLSYNDQGQLVDRGETAGAQAIMALLTDDWGYPVNMSELNPSDPIVNTSSEYMFQMATIAFHTLNGTQTVVLDKDVEYKGQIYKAGEYQVPIEGRYFSQLDRQNPLEGPAREQAWSGTAHALIAELGVGSVTASALQMGLGLAALFAALGATIVLTGMGLVWATRAETVRVPALRQAPITA